VPAETQQELRRAAEDLKLPLHKKEAEGSSSQTAFQPPPSAPALPPCSRLHPQFLLSVAPLPPYTPYYL